MTPADLITVVARQLAHCRSLAVAALRRGDLEEWERWLEIVATEEERLEELSAARAA